jgi:hypothetical protein
MTTTTTQQRDSTYTMCTHLPGSGSASRPSPPPHPIRPHPTPPLTPAGQLVPELLKKRTELSNFTSKRNGLRCALDVEFVTAWRCGQCADQSTSGLPKEPGGRERGGLGRHFTERETDWTVLPGWQMSCVVKAWVLTGRQSWLINGPFPLLHTYIEPQAQAHPSTQLRMDGRALTRVSSSIRRRKSAKCASWCGGCPAGNSKASTNNDTSQLNHWYRR